MPVPKKPCKYCKGLGHWPFQCFQNPDGKRKYVKPGKQALAWQQTRRNWFWDNQASFYICHYCGKQMLPGETTLDHKIPRSRAPHLRHDYDNIVTCCLRCNTLKGSVAHDDYVHLCK